MLFNSISFIIFLPITFVLYWSLQKKSLTYQNFLLLVASYIFYGWWDYRFLALILVSSLVDFSVGKKLEKEKRISHRKFLLAVSVSINLGILGFFKYFGFFVESFAELISIFGLSVNLTSLNIILPVGISFYTFQTLSYTIDIYRKKIHATDDIIAFFTFVAFFPQLVAGPIERASRLLPQFLNRRYLDVAASKDGLRQMLWGLWKKIMIADNVGIYVDRIYGHYQSHTGIELFIATFLFAIQIYCDFSGYSDIAIGTARLFGIKLRRNFAYPYFSRDIAEFWRRWHISLSTWFRDYVYIPLGGSFVSRGKRIWNIIITFTVSGFWHGANWTFIMWGFLNSLYYLPVMLGDKQKQHTNVIAEGRILPGAMEFLEMLITFLLVLFAWVFFRAESISHACHFLRHMFSQNWLYLPERKIQLACTYSSIMLVAEWFQRNKKHALEIENLNIVLRWGIYIALLVSILMLGNLGEVAFIYFQF